MRMQIDEARRDDLALRVDRLVRRMFLQIADLGNLAVLDPDVGLVTRQPRPIDDHSAADDYVKFCHV